jgi:hypothetical protein
MLHLVCLRASESSDIIGFIPSTPTVPGTRFLHNFAENEGGGPSGSLILSGTTLYGIGNVAVIGPNTVSVHTIFQINADGSGFYVDSLGLAPDLLPAPGSSLTLSGTAVYGGAASGAGESFGGTIYAMSLIPPVAGFTANPTGGNAPLTVDSACISVFICSFQRHT